MQIATGMVALALGLLLWPSNAHGQTWELRASGGYARSLEFGELKGGLAWSVGASRPWGRLRVGLEGGRFDLGESKTSRRGRTLIPSPQPAVFINELTRDGWYLNATLGLPLSARFAGIGSIGYYRLEAFSASEIRDSTGQGVLRPRIEFGGSSDGMGAIVGLRMNVFQPSSRASISFDLLSHFIGVKESGDDGSSFSLLQFFNARMGLAIGF